MNLTRSIVHWTGAALIMALMLLAGGAGSAPAVKPVPAPSTQPSTQQTVGKVGWLELSGPLRQGPPPFTFLGESDGKPSLRDVISQLNHVAGDAKSRGLVIHLDEPELDLTQIYQISQGIARIRAAHKKVLVFAQAYDLKSYLLASAADEVLLQHHGELQLSGLATEEMYLAGLLEKIGAKADFLQIGKFKGAEEPLTRTGPSAEWSSTIDGVLDGMYGFMVNTIAANRGMKREAVEKAIADCWTMSDKDYIKSGMIDRLVDRSLTDATKDVYGDDFNWDQDMGLVSPLSQPDNPLAFLRLLTQTQKRKITRPTIAVIHALGEINSGDSQATSAPLPGLARTGLFSSQSIGSRTMSEILATCRDNQNIKGVLIVLDSPGGSALASEVIWQALRELREADAQEAGLGKSRTPVYVVVGSLAASGGYYIASAADRIYASPTSIVGSIGVVAGKITLAGTYQKLGISVFRRSRGPMGDLFNSVEPFTPPQRDAMQVSMQRVYDQFIDRVTEGRGKRLTEKTKIEDVAQGRLFTGEQALKLGMIDKIGGYHDALTDLAAEVKLKPGSFDVVDYPEPQSLQEYLDSMFNATSPAPALALSAEEAGLAAAVRLLVGPEAFAQAQSVMSGLMLLRREPVLTLMPMVVRVK